jgi:cytochrome c biogenesis protein
VTDLDRTSPTPSTDALGDGSLQTEPAHASGPRLGVLGWARWGWRTLTSMRTALVLLALLALAAIPGSLLPQIGSSTADVAGFRRRNPELAPWLDRLGFFEVYSSPWFAAVYLLLLTSLTGCVLPRTRRLWRAWRADPPRAPSTLARYSERRIWITGQAVSDLLAHAASELRRRRFRIRLDADAVSAEKGYLREAGNLVLHLSLLILLFGVAADALYGFEGRVIVVEGTGFSNTRSEYDEFTPGPWVDETGLVPFSFTLEDFSASFEPTGPQRGSPRFFAAEVLYRDDPGTEQRTFQIRVNRPLIVGATKIFLTGHGYAPNVTVRDGRGETVFTGPVVFLPLDGNYASEGVVKVPDAQPFQLGFEGLFLPTAIIDEKGPRSIFPDTVQPRLLLNAWTGDLGLSGGVPQSVFKLDKAGLQQVTANGAPFAQALVVGETMTLPDGQGSITFDRISRFANFQIAYDPGKELSLLAALLLLSGVIAALTVRQRRIFIRASAAAGATRVEAAAFGLTRLHLPAGELDQLADALGRTEPHSEKD